VTADQKFTLLISGLGLIFIVMSALLGLIWRNGQNTGKVTTQISGLVEDVGRIATAIDEHIRWHLGDEPKSPAPERRTRRLTRPRSQADPTG